MINLTDLIFSFIMGCLMSLSITLVSTFVRIGIADHFFAIWLEAWFVAYPVAVVCILLYKPFVIKLTDKIVEKFK